MARASDLTVIIPTWNQAELLKRCLLSLQKQTVPCAILVVDNGSEDETLEMLGRDFSQVDCIHLTRNYGFARAANVGIERTRTPFVALLNNDTEADPGWVEAGLKGFRRHPDCWFFASRMLNHQRREKLDGAGDCYDHTGMPCKRGAGCSADQFRESDEVLGASAGAAFYRRALFERIGVFDETFYMYLEDVDLSLRARLLGLKCRYLPDAVVYHVEAASDPDRRNHESRQTSLSFYSSRRVYWITRNRWQLMIIYQPLRNLPWLAYGWGRSGLFHLLKEGYTGSFLRGVAAGIGRTPYALTKRMRLRKHRAVSTREWQCLLKRC